MYSLQTKKETESAISDSKQPHHSLDFYMFTPKETRLANECISGTTDLNSLILRHIQVY